MKYYLGPTFRPVEYREHTVLAHTTYDMTQGARHIGQTNDQQTLARFMREYALLCIENYNPELYRQLRELPEPILERIMTEKRRMDWICDYVFQTARGESTIREFLADWAMNDCEFCTWENGEVAGDQILTRACELHWRDDA